jgi:tetratricopeptide (TPR) repeat protein
VALFGGIAFFLALGALTGRLIFKGKKEVLDSIAVLPFENVNADPETEYLCGGITESLINKLSQLSVFKTVISRASSFAFKGEKINGEENGKKAESFANKALEMDPESPEAHLILGLINSAFFGNQQKGVYHLKKALAANPFSGPSRFRWISIFPDTF